MKLLATLAISLGLMSPAFAEADLLQKSWDEIVEQAKQEGEVTWFVWYFQPNFREMAKGFTEETGIKVNIPEGDLKGNAQKLLAEAGRDIGDIDVIGLGGEHYATMNEKELFLGPILPVLPEGENMTDKFNGGDAGGYAIAFWGNQSGIAYDSRAIEEKDLPNTIEELSAWMEANPGRLGFNYENGGAGPGLAQNIARNILRIKPTDNVPHLAEDMTPVWDWFNTRESQFTITASNADSVTRLNDGELLMAPAWEDYVSGQQKEHTIGDFIQIYVPAWGANGGANMVSIPKNAPHPAAALVFTAWLGSAKTQELFNARHGTVPTNSAAKPSVVLIPEAQRANRRDYGTPLPGVEFLPAFIENVIQN